MVKFKTDNDVDRESEISHYHEYNHPNMADFGSKKLSVRSKRGKDKGCIYYFKIFDNTILRPIFIYKWERIKKRHYLFDFEDVLREY